MSNLTQAWLEDQTSIRCLLVEITARNVTTSTEVTFYLSNMGYTTDTADVTYLPYLTGTLQTTESLGIDNNLSMSFGDIQVSNLNGELDSWLDSTKYIWVNRTVKVYLGDPRWTSTNLAAVHTNFEKVFDGVVADVDSSSRDTINIKVRDKLQRLNYPLTDNVLGTYGTWAGGQTNQDTIRPLIFGEVNNITPVLVDPSKLEYMFNDTSIGTYVTNTAINTNLITCISTAGFVINKPIIFTFSTTVYPSGFGGLVNNTTYYIKTIDSATTFTVAAVSTGGTTNTATAITLSNASLVSTGTTVNSVQAESNTTSTELLIEIRDNGVPIYTDASVFTGTGTRPQGATVSLTTGKFTLNSPAAGTITCSVQGVKRSVNLTTGALVEGTYVNTIPNIIALIVTQYGQPTQRLTASDIDLTNFSSLPALSVTPSATAGFIVISGTTLGTIGGIVGTIAVGMQVVGTGVAPNTVITSVNGTGTGGTVSVSQTVSVVNGYFGYLGVNTSAIGIPVLDRTNTLAVCQDIANAASAQLFFNRVGLLQLLQLGVPTSDATMSITDDNILHHSLHISQRTPVVAATKVGYCQNYTPQTALAASIPGSASVMFNDAWYSNTIVDASVQATYKLTSAPVQKDTRLIVGSDCATLATFLNNYFKVPHTVYAFTGTAKLLGLKLGQGVTLTHNRFGLNTGKSGQVITLAPDWVNGTVNVEVII